MGDLKIALSEVNTALSIDPYLPQIYDLKAKILVEMGDLDQGLLIAKQGLQIWESYGDLYITMGNIYLEQENYGEALMNYGLGLQNGNDEGLKGQGLVYGIIGQYEDAKKQLTAYLIDHPNDERVLLEIGINNQKLGNHELAIKQFDSLLLQNPLSYDTMFYKALSFEALEDYDTAITLLEEVIRNDDQNTKAIKELELIKTHLK
jgi:tetratricopeptide (TPR) repeat protein